MRFTYRFLIILRRPILLFLCSFVCVSAATAQSRSTITGSVFDSERRPINQVPVELMNEFNSVIQRTRTSGSGRYIFTGVGSGRFTIRVLPLGTNLDEQTQEVEIFGISADGRRQLSDNVQADFYLRPKRTNNDLVETKGVVFVQDIPIEARKLYETALGDLNSNRREKALTELQSAVSIFPSYYQALIRLGLIYTDLQKFENARQAFASAVSVNDRSFGGWYGLSYVQFALNDPASAVTSAQKALEFDKSSVNALFVLGLSQRRVKNYDDAEKALLQAKKLDGGKTPDINWNLALLYAHNLKRYRDAANELENYLKINPDVPNKEAVKKLIRQFRENPPS